MAADTAHFDTHDPAENVSFVGCVAIGGVAADKEVVGRFSDARRQWFRSRMFRARSRW
jgi:hypothetical protein